MVKSLSDGTAFTPVCGIAGILNPHGVDGDPEVTLRRMLASLRHRGPDEFGLYLDEAVALGSARLSILDLATGQQPIANEDGTLWIVFNGEIFNHIELRQALEARGHRFTTRTDTEVLLHLYEEYGSDCLHRLNGQFALAIWDNRTHALFLARDRCGIRPLFYYATGRTLAFGSEIKAILNTGLLMPDLDPGALAEVFTFWSPLPGKTVFRRVQELPPGHYLLADERGLHLRRYWQLEFGDSVGGARWQTVCPDESALVEEFQSLLVDATRARLRADVPVGAYLSGGLDSSTVAAIIRHETSTPLRTFSIAFTDASFDERDHQRRMADLLGTDHQVIEATHAEISQVFPKVVWHIEAPTLRTAPAPMLMLAGSVHEAGFKVVLTGEGADEFLAGYDIFKEAAVRRFWARQPESRRRPLLLQRLYPEIFAPMRPNSEFLRAFFSQDLLDLTAKDYSHAPRWRNTRRTWRFLSRDSRWDVAPSAASAIAPLVPAGFDQWGSLERAQFLEAAIFLPQYLLSAQGDRAAMAYSVEGRFPFLDRQVVDFCCRLPSTLKLRGLRDKRLLRLASRRWLPPAICDRRKQPYRAPIHRSFFHRRGPGYVREMLSPSALTATGLFHSPAVEGLVRKLEQGKAVGETDDMALAGILSTQLLHAQFIRGFRPASPLDHRDPVKVCRPVRPR